MDSPAIEAVSLRKAFGQVTALDGLSFQVPAGSVLGLLGSNGSGKTTAVSILSTSLRADAGRATVCGLDVVADAPAVRELIGFAGQFAAVDPNLTGRENLVLIGRLSRVDRKQAKVRAGELLDRFGLSAVAGRLVRTYSGGMRRRLDAAAALLHRPPVLFLDEPTTGLDPESRSAVWESIRDLTRSGTTVLLTTQYLDEADALADRVVIIECGRVADVGTPAALGLRVSDPEAAQAAGVPVMFVLVFTSCAFVPLGSMPGWLQAIGAHQPVNALVTAERALILGGSGISVVHDVLVSLAWSAGIGLAFAFLSARTYARMSR